MTGRGGILLVDDEDSSISLTTAMLAPLDLEVHPTKTGRAALEHLEKHATRVMVLDVMLPDMDGIAVLESALARQPNLAVVMLTGANDADTAVRALQRGAFDYLTKPVPPTRLLHAVERGLERERLLGEVHELREEAGKNFLSVAMGRSAKVDALLRRVNQVANSSMNVLVLGETGAGKELVAQAIHRASGRRDRPFIAIDCGAIPEALLESELFGHEEGAFTGARKKQRGQFQLAEGGTLFLDEIGNLSLANQAKLLRVLEERKLRPLGGGQVVHVDVRIIAATHARLEARTQDLSFRQDLYYRLAEFTIVVPPLRERPNDIPHLAHRFQEQAAAELGKPVLGFEEPALETLVAHPWPGNARELRNVVRRAVLACTGPTLSLKHFASILPLPVTPRLEPSRVDGPEAPVLPPEDLSGKSLKQIVDEATALAERRALAHVLEITQGNQTEAARLLQIDAKTLYRKMHRYGLKRS